MALPLIITDLDGCLVNLMDEVIKELYLLCGIPLMPELCDVYEVHHAFGPLLCPPAKSAVFASVEALNQYLIRRCWHNPKMLLEAKPYWFYWCALKCFLDDGGKVVALTGRDDSVPGLADATRSWLQHWLPRFTDVWFVPPCAEEDVAKKKRKACADLMYLHGGDGYVFVEDQPVVADYVSKHAPAKCTVLMPQRPWTIKAKTELKASSPEEYILTKVLSRHDPDELWEQMGQLQA